MPTITNGTSGTNTSNTQKLVWMPPLTEADMAKMIEVTEPDIDISKCFFITLSIYGDSYKDRVAIAQYVKDKLGDIGRILDKDANVDMMKELFCEYPASSSRIFYEQILELQVLMHGRE